MTVAVLGPSLMEPGLPGAASQPPWSITAHPPPGLAVALSALAIVAGAVGLLLSLNAIQRGWSMPARRVLLAGLLGAAVLAFLPPFGSSDHLSYAAYGRMAITGHNPFTTTPADLARLGDPVARAVQDWRTSPSVYGSVGVGIQEFAAWVGGTSVRLIVFVLSLVNVLAFAVTGLLLHWLGRGDAGRQLRAAVLWTANPLMLLILVAGAHIDAQTIVFGVAAVVLATMGWGAVGLDGRGERGGRRGVGRVVLVGAGAGALVGLGFAIKVTTALVGAGIAVGLVAGSWIRQSTSENRGEFGNPPQGMVGPALGGLAAGFGAAALVALVPWGTGMFGPALRAGNFTSVGSPWRAVRSGLRLLIGENAAEDVIKAGALVLAVLLLVLLLRYFGAQGELLLVGGAFAFVFAWLLAWPYVLPWYDGLGWALLAALPASRFDWLMVARTTALAVGYLPARGIPLPAGLGWLETVVRTTITPVALLVIVVLAVLWLWPRGRMRLVTA